MFMDELLVPFERYPSQRAVAQVMLRYGISAKEGKAYCGDIEITDAALSRAAKVDRRVVRATLERISSDDSMSRRFSKLKSICLLSDIAPEIGCSTLEIIPTNAKMPGILAEVTSVIFDASISVRQAVIDDSGPDGARLIIVMDGHLPPNFIPRIRMCRGVDGVILR